MGLTLAHLAGASEIKVEVFYEPTGPARISPDLFGNFIEVPEGVVVNDNNPLVRILIVASRQ